LVIFRIIRHTDHMIGWTGGVLTRARTTGALLLIASLIGASFLTAAPAQAVSAVAQPVVSAVAAPPVKSANLANFDPGHIISDAVFFNSGTMSEAQIQSFLESKVRTCQSGYTCLKDKRDNSRTIAADAMCNSYTGAANERASRIIYKVARACGINPQVLLVMLEKEQSLVSHTWPSDYRYQAAMGQGCPDTAACDTRYYGFFNQVHGAAWQLKRYANPPGTSAFFTWYAPGKTWNILYNPNSNCGSSPVYVQNQATSNLYYYTPYQPNASALRAGYGEGDGCASYGNRNFYQFFTDWFGATQVNSHMVKAGPHVWFTTGTTRYHIVPATLAEYQRVFGAPVSVADSYLASFRDGGTASLIIRNASTGQVSMLDGGVKHWFKTCALVAAWGVQCESETRLTNPDFAGIRDGADMDWFARTTAGGFIHKIDGKTLQPYYDDATARGENGGRLPYAAVMSAATSKTYAVSRMMFAKAQFISTNGRVYLPTRDGRLLYMSSWAHAASYGLAQSLSAANVPASAVSGYSVSGSLSPFATCNGQTYYAGGGQLYPVTAQAASGFGVTALDASVCQTLTLRTGTAKKTVFVNASGSSAVYVASAGTYRHVTSRAALEAMNGGSWPEVISIPAAALGLAARGEPISTAPGTTAPPAQTPTATPAPPKATPTPTPTPTAPAVTPGKLVRSTASSQTYLATADRRAVYLPSWSIAEEWGYPTRAVEALSPAVFGTLRVEGTLGLFASCAGTPVYASRGTLHTVAPAAASGFTLTQLDAGTCALFSRSSAAPLSRVFVQATGQSAIYVADAGVYRHVTTPAALTALGGGVWPPVLALSPDSVARLPLGEPWR
jgi:hypothetical protein